MGADYLGVGFEKVRFNYWFDNHNYIARFNKRTTSQRKRRKLARKN